MIEVHHLVKHFTKIVKEKGVGGSLKSLFAPQKELVRAVDDVSFQVAEGEILGFIGPNGAGKSTVIKMLTGILSPTDGWCRINGYIPQKERKRYVREIGVVFGQRTQLWWDLPLTETYTVLKEIYDIPSAEYKQRLEFLDHVLELGPILSSPVRTLSLGQRMRADIAASMLHKPRVLFLDEPTIGLDIVVKDSIRRAIREINRTEKTTIILTTHDLNDIEQLCQRIVLIDKGKLVYDGDLDRIRTNFGKIREITFMLEEADQVQRIPFPPHEDLDIKQEGAKIRLRFNTEVCSLPQMLAIILQAVQVKDISVQDVDIEEILRRVYQRQVAL
ncbi:ABC transporter ATP-binding protein [Gracilinema caldarium]|uniref:ABC transporter related protein n=1 Tax=Gracilinema caldarium (strain ATCC 51460 / DSM 7334 / H1) TaxID=744872 RepID=F8F0X0_GRAC1|nr:ATP-binding cassette domain-containing protein [Gracilinema caldarium]AEJ20256.1 ABC transporter related protein [Gracilinema caldarium DSM 7334]